MKKRKIFASVLCAGLLFFGGCSREQTQTFSHLVMAVDITCQHKDVRIARHYTDQQKMEYVLLYLRLLEPAAHLPSPETVQSGDTYEICLQLGDGKQKRYRQHAHRYLSVDRRPWQAIDPGQAEGLYRLMRTLPSDSI